MSIRVFSVLLLLISLSFICGCAAPDQTKHDVDPIIYEKMIQQQHDQRSEDLLNP